MALKQFVLIALSLRSMFAFASDPAYERAHRPLPHDVYIWQRLWTPPVREAISQHSSAFSNLVVLNAEVSWNHGEPEVVRAAVDFDLVRTTKRPIGLALRIGPYSGPFAADDKVGKFLTNLANSLVDEARAKGVPPAELQIDFDCAESKLDGYRAWVTAIRKAVAPMPVVITALPSWLRQSAFGPLVRASDGFILQAHSLEKPKTFDAPFTLCDPAVARTAVERASAFGVPFRVALPTYGYLVAFASNGHFVGLSAEGPAKSWPTNARLREVRSDPLAMSQLVQSLNTNHPAALRGIIWYRFPIADDILNWRWPTLGAIVASRSPRESVRVEPRRVEAGLVEISLVNDGELDLSSRLAVEVRWQNDRLVAADALRGFELVEEDASTARFQTQSQPCQLPAGGRLVIGWLRFDRDREVKLELKKQ